MGRIYHNKDKENMEREKGSSVVSVKIRVLRIIVRFLSKKRRTGGTMELKRKGQFL